MVKLHPLTLISINLKGFHIMKRLMKGLLIVIVILFCFIIEDSYGVNWPLRINVSGKYLEDQSGVPFLIVGDAGWELTTQITDAQAIAYINDRAAKGFNAIEIRIIGRAYQTNKPNDYYNNAPFTGGVNDWSSPNSTYWARMDTILTKIKENNMVAIVFPAYLGYGCSSDHGWCQNMINQTNSAMQTYGAWIGNRYKDYGNIIWMTGGDVDCTPVPNACNRNNAVVTGIRSADTDAIFSVEPAPGQIGGINSYTSVVDINAIYTYGNPQTLAQTAYGNSRPFMFQEGYYENEHGTSVITQDSQAMITYLGGGLIGHIFGSCPLWSFGAQPGWCNSSSTPFDSWTNNLNSPGSVSSGNIGKLMRSRKWWTFVPDYSNTVVTSSKGSELNYHATAREVTGETVMVWCPDTNQVTVDMTKISGSIAKCYWWNPSDNSSVLIGTFNTTGTRNFTPSSARKVLVLDNESLGLAAPGTTVYSPDKVPPSPPTDLRIISQ